MITYTYQSMSKRLLHILNQQYTQAFCVLSWGGLGAYRGAQFYNKEYKKDYDHYLKHIEYSKKPQYYYLSCFGHSCIFSTCYVVLFPVSLVIEMYNFEETIRGINNDNNK